MATKQIKGVLGEKLGMTQVFDDAGKVVPVTVLKAGPCVVSRVRTPEQDGYSAIQLGYGSINPRKVNKPLGDYLRRHELTPRRHYVEVRTADASEYELGQELTAAEFETGELVDVTGKSKGKGTAGTIKRYGFSRQGASHGTHRVHRKPGAIGGAATPGRVFKGMRMAGRTGNARTTVQNLQVQSVDTEKGLILVKGAVPGPNGGLVLVRTAVKGDK
ncbi:50S ribosomal protein L3 [Lipingzhangella sp. LS1_29]|uniref:Large ribosomal subunit protein uL3 n=1 Tax=Lipingzhangella rawalii TaxID=2055835 RepID=A0ABU2H4N0_9ACTN|nr:50S ribosomal protein L3 [Lipingzhangella rawalii]MDS1269957.1 50S ribosomal protein L3 [Lipingzhangella rawalii]